MDKHLRMKRWGKKQFQADQTRKQVCVVIIHFKLKLFRIHKEWRFILSKGKINQQGIIILSIYKTNSGALKSTKNVPLK